MKRAKQVLVHKPHYRLADLLAQCAPGPIELSAEMRAWENMAPVGREVIDDECRRQSRLVALADAADTGLHQFTDQALVDVEGWAS